MLLTWEAGRSTWPTPSKSGVGRLIYWAVDSDMRWSELVGPRRSETNLHRRKVPAREQLTRLSRGVAASA